MITTQVLIAKALRITEWDGLQSKSGGKGWKGVRPYVWNMLTGDCVEVQ